MAQGGSSAAWGSLVAGLASCVTLPLAVFLTRFSDSYELLHAGFAIPLAAGLGFVALALARRARIRTRGVAERQLPEGASRRPVACSA